MTATIDPRGMQGLSVNDLNERTRQYLETLQFYLGQNSIQQIVFIENSAYDLKAFHDLASQYQDKKIEIISCQLNDYPRQRGKSYGEMRILDYVVLHSTLIRNANGFIKVTGRFPILNIPSLLLEAERRQPWELFCDNKDHKIYDWLHLGWTGHACDTRFFIVTIPFYQKYFFGRCEELDDSQHKLIEFLFFHTAQKASCECKVIRRFRTEPEYAGKAGHVQAALLQVNDYSGWVAKAKRKCRQLARRFTPWFWF